MPQSANIAMQKKHLRERAIERRMAMDSNERRVADEAIARHLDALFEKLEAEVLGFCWPHRGEPDLRGWVAAWLAADACRSAALPVVVAPRRAMVFRQWSPGCAMVEDRYGIPRPVEGTVLHPGAVLIPVNAFDQRGYRIGYGGGYFDRTLAALHPAPLGIGIGYRHAQVNDALPEAHDLPMAWIVTDAAILRPAGASIQPHR